VWCRISHCLLKHNVVFKKALYAAGGVKKSPTISYFAKRDPDETICEKITGMNIFSKPILRYPRNNFGT